MCRYKTKTIRAAALIAGIIIAFCAFPTSSLASAQPSAPSCSAQAYCLMSGDGVVLSSSCADERLPMASTTKIMTALIAIENLNMDDIVTISPKAAATEGSSAYLIEGERISVRELLFALMLSSANDAAQALCESVEGGEEAFVLLMNEKAARLGLANTHFDNPHGLDSATHYTTARELAAICAYALEDPDFRSLCSCKSRVARSESGIERVFVNHNRLLFSYDGCIGVKTGYTIRDGRCLVSAATRDSLTLICVTLNDRSDWADHRALLDWGFENFEYYPIAAKRAIEKNVPIKGASSPFALCRNEKPFGATLAKGEHTIEYEYSIYSFSSLESPVFEGDKAGEVRIIIDGELKCTLDLYAAGDYKKEPKGIKKFIQRIFAKIGELFQ